AVFAIAVQTAFFEMLPISVTIGNKLFRWNGVVWALTFIPVVFLLAHTMLNPTGNFLTAFQTANVRAIAVLLLVLIGITFLFWFYVRVIVRRLRRGSRQAAPVPAEPSYAPGGMTQPINRSPSGKSQSEIPTQQPFQPPLKASPQLSALAPAARP